SARELFTRLLPRASADDIEMRVDRVMTRIATGPIKPPAPLSQSLAEVDDSRYGLGTHPDIIEHMWKLDQSLPQRCRWVFWGLPAWVNRQAGVGFAVVFGTMGYAMGLPPQILETAAADQVKAAATGNPGQIFDIAPLGSEWRFVLPRAPEADWCRAAYELAG